MELTWEDFGFPIVQLPCIVLNKVLTKNNVCL